jgi:hypothetical protein
VATVPSGLNVTSPQEAKGNGHETARNFNRVDSLITVASKIAKYKLDLAGVQEVRLKRCGNEPVGEYITFFKLERES